MHLHFVCINFYFTFQATINQLRTELAKGPQEVAVYVQEIQKLKGSINELTQKNQVRVLKLHKVNRFYLLFYLYHRTRSLSISNKRSELFILQKCILQVVHFKY